MTARFATAYTGAHIEGARVMAVDAGSPAERAGLQAGDLIGCINTRDCTMLRSPFCKRPTKPISSTSV
jgi:C-terminal processing protease CtpA/Prc